MSQSYSRVALAAHKSLHGCGILCWCSQSGKPGATCNTLISLSVRPCTRTSKATGNNLPIDKDVKQKGQSAWQDRLKYLRTLASTRVHDGIHCSRETFVGSFYSWQTQPEKGAAKLGDKEESALGEDGKMNTSDKYDVSSVSVDKHLDLPSIPDADLKESYDGNELHKEASTKPDVASHQTRDNGIKYTQTDFWINIPSFQDRMNRLKAPFWRTKSPSSEYGAESEFSQGKTVDHLKNKDGSSLWYGEWQTQHKSRDADSMKPKSYEVTAEVESEHLSELQSHGSRGKTGTPSPKSSSDLIIASSTAMQNVINSGLGLKSADENKTILNGNKSLHGPDDSDAFDLKASPILDMNVALLNESRGVQEVIGKQVSPVKETVKEAKMRKDTKMRKDRAMEAGDVASKKPRKQIKPVISKACIDDRTRNLAIGIRSATTNSMRLLKLERLATHLIQYPESRGVAVKEKLIPSLLKIQTSWDRVLTEQVNETLALLGYAAPVKGRGLRILSIDGGGTRGVIAIETLREIEHRTNRPIRELFDYVMGVSSGAVLGFLLAFDATSLDECEELYKELSQEVFKRNTFLGTSKLFLNHAFYDTEGWIKILKSHSLGDVPMISTARHTACPKVAAVATLMNVGYIKDFLFRNYNLPPGTRSQYRGACKYDLWQAARASSAAPGYFEECKLDEYVFQDGGVLTNNPCALAIHECRLLWPETPIQCVVSVGCGRYDPEDGHAEPEYSSLKKKLTNIMISATDTESVHTVLQDLLPSGTYFRFNPSITEDFLLDENQAEKIEQMQQEARDYLEMNELKLEQASGILSRKKTHFHRALDWVRMQRKLRR